MITDILAMLMFLAVTFLISCFSYYCGKKDGHRDGYVDGRLDSCKYRRKNIKVYNDGTEKFYCEFRDYEVTYRKTCKNCVIASVDKDGNFYCPFYRK